MYLVVLLVVDSFINLNKSSVWKFITIVKYQKVEIFEAGKSQMEVQLPKINLCSSAK